MSRSLPSLGAVLLPAITRAVSAWMCVPGPLPIAATVAGAPAQARRTTVRDVPLSKEKQQ